MSNFCEVCQQPLSSRFAKKYCSISCSTVTGTARLQLYSKIKNTEKYELYKQTTKQCAYCMVTLNFDKKRNKFCSKSCSAHFNNAKRKPSADSNVKRRSTLIARHIQSYNLNPKQCLHCQRALDYNNRKQQFCSQLCKQQKVQKINITQECIFIDIKTKLVRCICAKTGEVFYAPTWRKYSSETIYNELSLYRNACQFTCSIGDNFPNAMLLKQHGWYHPILNPHGVSRDHKLSINDGFQLRVDPSIMKHPANCELMIHKDNQRKHKKSSIDLETLLKVIAQWPF